MRGLFITLEGPEGAGKSSQLGPLCDWLESQGREVVCTRNPGGTAIGKQIRQLLLDPANAGLVPTAELMLYAADRAQHVAEVVRPALEAGSVVLCDRFGDSTLAYQGYGRGLDLETIRALNAMATGGLSPDLTLLLDLDPTIGLARIAATRESDRLEQAAIDFHYRLRDGYRALAAAEPQRFVVVDANQDREAVQRALREAIRRLLPVGGPT
ncbi:MAG TPA: dTMP kinase [Oscillatoriaceae cyanobacterium]